VQLATTQALARHRPTDHDWRKIEAKLNALPPFITEIDRLEAGYPISFMPVRNMTTRCRSSQNDKYSKL
jgi:epoxide hydrolase-like protein